MTAVALPAVRLAPRGSRRAWAVALLAVTAVMYVALRGEWVFPHDPGAPVFATMNAVRDWVDSSRGSNPVFLFVVDPLRVTIDAFVDQVLGAIRGVGWPAVLGIAGALGYLAGGRRIATLMVVGFVVLGVLGLWEESLDTLGVTLASVALSLAIGIPLGIVAARSPRFQAVINPILDVMQIMPAFAYLVLIALLFRIGGASAAIATLIFAMPAAIRITALAIRGVPGSTVEATRSLGGTGSQILRKVELPLASRVIGLAINQTIMLALGMVVVTVLIDAPGLGVPIIRALERSNVGVAFDAGIAIVILAILLDRLTEHASARMDARRHLDGPEAARRRLGSRLAVGIAAATIVAARFVPNPESFPDVVTISFREPVNAVISWLKANLFDVTEAIKVGFTEVFLNPLQTVLTSSPWWLVVAVVVAIGLLVSGWRAAATAGVCLLLVAGLQLWEHGMETLASVLVATAITLVVGVVLGIVSARSDRFSALLRPGLDFAQTMPSFVYLLPAVALFQAGRFTAVVAAVIYAAPPVIRLVEAGIRSVPPTIVESAMSSGVTRSQLLWKVQLPVARPALLLAANQGIVLVLAMVVVGALVGAGALGYDVISGLAQSEDFGKGLAAGVSIVLLGIMLDRITQGAGTRRARLPRAAGA